MLAVLCNQNGPEYFGCLKDYCVCGPWLEFDHQIDAVSTEFQEFRQGRVDIFVEEKPGISHDSLGPDYAAFMYRMTSATSFAVSDGKLFTICSADRPDLWNAQIVETVIRVPLRTGLLL